MGWVGRWMRWDLKVGKFRGGAEKAIRLQILAAMIAYLLLRIAARESRLVMPAIRFAGLVAASLFVRKPVADIDRPPEVNPSAARARASPHQFTSCYPSLPPPSLRTPRHPHNPLSRPR